MKYCQNMSKDYYVVPIDIVSQLMDCLTTSSLFMDDISIGYLDEVIREGGTESFDGD